MNERHDLRELATRLREKLGVDGLVFVDNGGGLFCTLAPLTVAEWESRYSPPIDEPAPTPQEPEEEAHNPKEFLREFGGIRLERP